jgi:hypothetical protein
MIEQLWYCNHWTKETAITRYKIVDGELYQRNNECSEWYLREEAELTYLLDGNLISVTIPESRGIGPISFQLTKC